METVKIDKRLYQRIELFVNNVRTMMEHNTDGLNKQGVKVLKDFATSITNDMENK